MPNPQLDFAPISSDRSLRLRIAAAYLRLSAVLTLGVVAITLVGAIIGQQALRRVVVSHPIQVMLGGLVGAGLWIAARDLSNKLRRGGYAALISFGVPLAASLLAGTWTFELVITLGLGLGAVATAWTDLD